MAKRNDFLRVRITSMRTEVLVHISSDGTASDYATLCGLDEDFHEHIKEFFINKQIEI